MLTKVRSEQPCQKAAFRMLLTSSGASDCSSSKTSGSALASPANLQVHSPLFFAFRVQKVIVASVFLRVGLILLFFANSIAAEPGLLIRFHWSSTEHASSGTTQAKNTATAPLSNLPFAAFYFPLDQSPALGEVCF